MLYLVFLIHAKTKIQKSHIGDLLRHFEELISLWFPNASNKLLEITYQTTSST